MYCATNSLCDGVDDVLGLFHLPRQKLAPWNQEVTDAIHGKKVAYKAWLQNKADSLHSRYAGSQKFVRNTMFRTRTEFQLLTRQRSVLANHPASLRQTISWC